MIVLSISGDRKIFDQKSDVHARMRAQAAHMQALHVVIYTKESDSFEKAQYGNLFIYPTRSKDRLRYIPDGVRIGRSILATFTADERKKTVLTTQDPHDTGTTGLLLKWFEGVPLQVQVHIDLFNRHFTDRSILDHFRQMIALKILKRADGVRVVSELIARSLEQRLGTSFRKKLTVLPVYMNITETLKDVVEPEKKDTYEILVVSRLEKEKNVGLSIDVFERVVQKYPDAHLTVVGDGSLRSQLEQKAGRKGLGGSIDFAGWQHNLSPYYTTASIFLNTSNYEGYGRTLLEAAYAQCAIVSTKVGIVGDILREGEDVIACPVEDTSCLTRACMRMIENNNERIALGRHARESVQERVLLDSQQYYAAYARALESLVPHT